MFAKDEVDRLLPPTIDEMRAEDENEKAEREHLKRRWSLKQRTTTRPI